MSNERGNWSSRLGFVLAAAGSAIGLGAIWKFPYMAGANGGGAFLVVYLAAVLGIGLTMMLAELAIGRATQTDAVNAFGRLGGTRWRFFGYFSLFAAFLILSFYCVIGGWTIGYLFKAITGSLLEPGEQGFAEQFTNFAAKPLETIGLFAAFMALTAWIILGGVKKGIERASKVLMPLLFILILVMIIRSLTLPGAMEGVRFFLIPDFGKITSQVLIEALGFACFSLSLGFAGMLTYGSYMRQDENMTRSALWVIALQTLCVIMAGFMVLPAVFAFGMEPSAGPGLTYITLPAVFQAMPAGRIFATMFFLLLLLAALTSSVSILEPLVAWLIDHHKINRRAACVVMASASFIFGIPATLSFGIGADWTLFGYTPFDVMDKITSNFMLPVNVLAACILMGWVANKTFIQELYKRHFDANGISGEPFWAKLINIFCKFLAPVVIGTILIASLIPVITSS